MKWQLRNMKQFVETMIWDKVFKSAPSGICGRQPLRNLKRFEIQIFKVCLPQISLGSFLNTLSTLPGQQTCRKCTEKLFNHTDSEKEEIETEEKSNHVNMSFESATVFVNQTPSLFDTSPLKALIFTYSTVKLNKLTKLTLILN